MKIPIKIKGAFHTLQSFKKHGLKQVSTWLGIVVFTLMFGNDLITLVHNVLTDAALAEKLAAGLSAIILVWFNKMGSK